MIVLLLLRCWDPASGQLDVRLSEEIDTGVAGSIAEVSGCIWSVFSMDRACARSVAWTSLLGGSSLRTTHPCGGLGGGEMKNILETCGASRSFGRPPSRSAVGSPK